jgi:hypothetical protein
MRLDGIPLDLWIGTPGFREIFRVRTLVNNGMVEGVLTTIKLGRFVNRCISRQN